MHVLCSCLYRYTEESRSVQLDWSVRPPVLTHLGEKHPILYGYSAQRRSCYSGVRTGTVTLLRVREKGVLCNLSMAMLLIDNCANR